MQCACVLLTAVYTTTQHSADVSLQSEAVEVAVEWIVLTWSQIIGSSPKSRKNKDQLIFACRCYAVLPSRRKTPQSSAFANYLFWRCKMCRKLLRPVWGTEWAGARRQEWGWSGSSPWPAWRSASRRRSRGLWRTTSLGALTTSIFRLSNHTNAHIYCIYINN